MARDVADYVRACVSCAKNKSPRQRPAGLLYPMPVADRPWGMVGMDFVVGLPKSRNCTIIWVITDHFSKMVHLVPLPRLPSARDLAVLFIKHIFRLHGMPDKIVSDRGPQFASRFWRELCRLLSIELNLSSAYHPETNGLVERANQTLVTYLHFVSARQDDWASLLPWAEFALNNAIANSTGQTPFFLNYGQHPHVPVPMPVSSADSRVADWAVEARDIWDRTQDAIRASKERIRSSADAHRRPAPGDLVWLSARNIRLRVESTKFAPRYLGPFEVLEQVNPVVYRLALPPRLGITDTFHVSLLKPVYMSRFSESSAGTSGSSTDDYEVNAILGCKVVYTTGSKDEMGVCHCSVALPDITFPADRLEILEISNKDLSVSVQQEITKMHSYQATLTGYVQKLKNLTRRVEVMEMGGISYTQLDFELLRLEIREMESLVVKLRESIDGSNTLVEALYVEVHNISIMVSQLESYDKNNVLAVRREIALLRKRLEDCEKNKNNQEPPSVNYDLEDGGKDSFAGSNKDVHWVAPLTTDARMMNIIRFYPDYDNLLLYKGAIEKVLTKNLPGNRYDYSNCGQGGGVIMFNNSLYYNCYNTRDICKFNVDTNAVERRALPDATFNNRFSYASSVWQDIDLASDEDGLWVIYSTEQNAGNIVIGKLNPLNLTVENTWVTSQYKLGATNAFMVCGVLYVTRTLSTRREEIFYMYDTNTGEEGQISIILDKMMENVQSLSYNPNDHKLYMYNDGYLVTYNLDFKALPNPS
ncbi:unnamed protein product [Ranitomeya imitator]|uniref:Uncharacterized protein n=1 Tax=Ranitomeya imitator TaxID=111125 RepID=A0ABN9KMN7_9NEOB|nr:unnamed protein product [Ranitomeya imitator]